MFHLIVIALFFCLLGILLYLAHLIGIRWKGKVIIALILICAPFWDSLLVKEILLYHFITVGPLQHIEKVVEFPISVYWEDNVWPGFDTYGRHWMVKNYLDGIHILSSWPLTVMTGKYIYSGLIRRVFPPATNYTLSIYKPNK